MRRIISSVKKTVQIKTLTQTMEYITSALWKSRERDETYSLILSRNKEVARAELLLCQNWRLLQRVCAREAHKANQHRDWRQIKLRAGELGSCGGDKTTSHITHELLVKQQRVLQHELLIKIIRPVWCYCFQPRSITPELHIVSYGGTGSQIALIGIS